MSKCEKFSKFVGKAIESFAAGDLERINLAVHDFKSLQQVEVIEVLKQLQSKLLVLESQLLLFGKGDYSLTIHRDNKQDRIWKATKQISATQIGYINDIKKVVAGQFSAISFEYTDKDELGSVLDKILENFKYVLWRLSEVAEGDVRAKIAPLNESDELGIGLDDLTRSLREVTEIAEKVAAGDFSSKLKVKGEKDLLSKSINIMIDNLCEIEAKHQEDTWVKTGQNELSNMMRGELDLEQLTTNIVSFIAKYNSLNVGVFYLNKNDQELEISGSYAFTRRRKYQKKIAIGEGLVGQVALDKQTIVLSEAPKDYLEMTSSLGHISTTHLLITPILLGDELKGVMEFGSLEPISEKTLTLIALVSENIAMAIKATQDHDKLQDLLEETQNNQDQLAKANDDLEKQTQALKQNEEELQTQSEELQQTNEELEEKTKYLQKQAQEIEKKNQFLEDAQRTIEEKMKELEKTNQYKSEFLANMSHELRTPLNSIMILAGLLEENDEGNLTEDQVESAGVVLSSAGDLLTLINDILDLCKVEAGKMTANVEVVDLESLLTNLKLEFDALALKKGLNIIIDSADNIPEAIETDRQRISQILRNLVSNAIKFTQNGAITIKLFCPDKNNARRSGILKNTNLIAFSVMDTGIGIPEEKQKLIFEAFQQADGSTSREFGGSGLGLTISREFAQLLKGDIEIESTVNRGSTFTLYLPIKNDDIDATPNDEHVIDTSTSIDVGQVGLTQSRESISEEDTNVIEEFKARSEAVLAELPEGFDPKGKNILLIEDDMNFCYTLKEIGSKSGYRSLIASEGQTGLTLAKQCQPKGIILDLNLPDMDGTEVLQQLKADAETMDIPIHIISGMEEINNVQEQGATGFLKKPVTVDDIKYVFEKIAPINDSEDGRKYILLIEDNKINRESIVKLLQKDDLRIDSVATATEAEIRLIENNYDCIISDLRLPDADGFNLIKQLKEQQDLKVPPIIAYTGKELSKEEHDELSKYADSIVAKGGQSPVRLLEEVELFLHHVELALPPEDRFEVPIHNEGEDDDEGVIFKGETILIVDDDIRNTFALSKALNTTGLEIHLADNGTMAIERLQEFPNISLILMDIMMPVMNGYEATAEIRKMDAFKGLPIIALTAKAMPEDRTKCIEAGADDYITKPIDIKMLTSMLQVWLNKR